jgi:hypothetical protein
MPIRNFFEFRLSIRFTAIQGDFLTRKSKEYTERFGEPVNVADVIRVLVQKELDHDKLRRKAWTIS